MFLKRDFNKILKTHILNAEKDKQKFSKLFNSFTQDIKKSPKLPDFLTQEALIKLFTTHPPLGLMLAKQHPLVMERLIEGRGDSKARRLWEEAEPTILSRLDSLSANIFIARRDVQYLKSRSLEQTFNKVRESYNQPDVSFKLDCIKELLDKIDQTKETIKELNELLDAEKGPKVTVLDKNDDLLNRILKDDFHNEIENTKKFLENKQADLIKIIESYYPNELCQRMMNDPLLMHCLVNGDGSEKAKQAWEKLEHSILTKDYYNKDFFIQKRDEFIPNQYLDQFQKLNENTKTNLINILKDPNFEKMLQTSLDAPGSFRAEFQFITSEIKKDPSILKYFQQNYDAEGLKNLTHKQIRFLVEHANSFNVIKKINEYYQGSLLNRAAAVLGKPLNSTALIRSTVNNGASANPHSAYGGMPSGDKEYDGIPPANQTLQETISVKTQETNHSKTEIDASNEKFYATGAQTRFSRDDKTDLNNNPDSESAENPSESGTDRRRSSM